MSDSASLKIGDKESGYPIRSGTIGPDVIDIRKLYAETGCFTYDPGFTSTASCDSAPTTPHMIAIGCASRRKPR